MQLGNSEDITEREGLPWYKGEGREMENTMFACLRWDVGFKKPRSILLTQCSFSLPNNFHMLYATEMLLLVLAI